MATENDSIKGNVQEITEEIGHAFIHQYYTTLSDVPDDVYQFYGIDSTQIFNNVFAKGHEEIKKEVKKINFSDCKVRIFTVAGTTVSVSPNTLVYQICGELTLFDDVPRRFFQTIVLVSQVAKAYYLESNIFQWVDTAFSINFKNINSEESLLNGDLQSHQVSISPSPDESDQKFQLELKNNRMVNGTSENRVTELITSKDHKNQPPQTKKSDAAKTEIITLEQKASATQKFEGPNDKLAGHLKSLQDSDSDGKKTWANVANKNVKTMKQSQNHSHSESSPDQSYQKHSPPPSKFNSITNKKAYNERIEIFPNKKNSIEHYGRRPMNPINYNYNQGYTKDPDNVIYFSMLEKKNPNPSIHDGEAEIRSRIEEITKEVNKVFIKNSSLRKETKYAIGQIIMKNKEAVSVVYSACQKVDDRYKLLVNVPAFSFEGEIILGSQKTTPDGDVLPQRTQYVQRNYGRYDSQNRERDFTRDRDYNGPTSGGYRQGTRNNFHFVNRNPYKIGFVGKSYIDPDRNSYGRQYQFGRQPSERRPNK